MQNYLNKVLLEICDTNESIGQYLVCSTLKCHVVHSWVCLCFQQCLLTTLRGVPITGSSALPSLTAGTTKMATAATVGPVSTAMARTVWLKVRPHNEVS